MCRLEFFRDLENQQLPHRHHAKNTLANMPPKKKAKASQRGVSTPAADEDTMDVDAPSPEVEESNEPAYDILKDPWTDEQETSLFKGIIRWKPNGN